MNSTAEIAWLAGLLEGEGCFGMHASGKYLGTPKIALQMSDEDVVRRAADMFGRPCNGPYGPYGASKKQTWQTMVTGSDAIAWMFTIYSFLGDRRKRKVESVVAIWKEMQTINPNRKPTCHQDRKYAAKGLCHPCYMKQYHERSADAHTAP